MIVLDGLTALLSPFAPIRREGDRHGKIEVRWEVSIEGLLSQVTILLRHILNGGSSKKRNSEADKKRVVLITTLAEIVQLENVRNAGRKKLSMDITYCNSLNLQYRRAVPSYCWNDMVDLSVLVSKSPGDETIPGHCIAGELF
jgi:hypothetical protein